MSEFDDLTRRESLQGRSETTSGAPASSDRRQKSLIAGDMLNGIYRVDRFIARGGMGEVHEAINIETDERVAIKILRSHLAADTKLIAMLRKEARILTQISHPAVVQYRVFARDQALDLYYIVTDYINGEPLSTLFEEGGAPVYRVLALARRIAAGLEAAHEGGAVHRDIAPDNILLPEGRLERAKIIDFGIAKNADIGAETLVGTDFAGKLNFAAPEQFGDFDHHIGPWTDIYSTALVLAAYARGRPLDMGRTLSEAVVCRRDIPDLSDLPILLRPLLASMLIPDPAHRCRSIGDVRARLDALASLPGPAMFSIGMDVEVNAGPVVSRPDSEPVQSPASEVRAVPVSQSLDTRSPADSSAPRGRTRRVGLLVGSGGAALALAASVALFMRQSEPNPPKSMPMPIRPVLGRSATPAVAGVSNDLRNTLNALPCTWIDVDRSQKGPIVSGATHSFGALAEEAQARGAGLDVARTARVGRAQCNTLETLRALVGAPPDGLRLALDTPRLVLRPGEPLCSGGIGARADVELTGLDPRQDTALVALTPGQRLAPVFVGRTQFGTLAARYPDRFRRLPDGALHATFCVATPGVTGMLLLQGQTPIGLGDQARAPSLTDPSFTATLRTMAGAQHWTGRAAWLRAESVTAPLPPNEAGPGLGLPVTRSGATVPEAGGALAAPLTADGKSGSSQTSVHSGTEACRRYNGNRWEELGYKQRNECVVQIFQGRCDISAGFFGDQAIRRYNGRIEAQRDGHWSAIARADPC